MNVTHPLRKLGRSHSQACSFKHADANVYLCVAIAALRSIFLIRDSSSALSPFMHFTALNRTGKAIGRQEASQLTLCPP